VSTLLRLLDSAVQKHIYADGKVVGVNLSGGLDSSTVASLALRWRPMRTFTGWYDVPGYDERRYAHMVADAAKSEHRDIQITPTCFVENFDDMLKYFKPPWQGPGMFGQYMVAKYIANHTNVRAVLSGEGSDELFGGYARTLHAAGMPLPDGYDGYTPPADYPEMLEEALAYDYLRLPDLLAVDDGTLGAFGIEGRAPFTDRKVVDYALALNPLDRVGKRHLREAVRGVVPDPIIDRTDKQGFPVFPLVWANETGNPVRDFIGDRLGYIPDPAKPFDRGYWNELCDRSRNTRTFPTVTTTSTNAYPVFSYPSSDFT
jgi:asparagine synthase (glutamine-hydrolysing)